MALRASNRLSDRRSSFEFLLQNCEHAEARRMLMKYIGDPHLESVIIDLENANSGSLDSIDVIVLRSAIATKSFHRAAEIRWRILASPGPHTLETFLSLAISPDPLERWEGVRGLVELDDPGGFPCLRAAIEDPDINVRVEAVRAAASRRDSHVLSQLIRVAMDDKDEARAAAITALGRLPERESFDALRALASNGNVNVREDAFRALYLCCPQDIAETIRQGLTDSTSGVRELARACYQDCPESVGSDTTAQWISDPNEFVRAAALDVLGDINPSGGIRHAKLLLSNDSAEEVRVVAAELLASKQTNDRVTDFISALQDPSMKVRRVAIIALGKHPEARVIDELRALRSRATFEGELKVIDRILQKLEAALAPGDGN